MIDIRLMASLSLLSCIVASAHGYATGTGGADDQTWVDSMGADITLITEPFDYYNPSIATGSGINGYSNTINTPPSGGVYYNTNSFTLVPTTGEAYEESASGSYYFFTNNSATTIEAVTLSWEGYVSSAASASGYKAFSYDIAESYIEDANANIYPFYIDYQSYSGIDPSGSDYGSGDYTFYVNPLATYEIYSSAYNISYSVTPTPSPAAVVPFVAGVVGLVRRKRLSSIS